MEPRHAVAVATVPKGSKRHDLLADLAEDEADFARTVQRYRYDRLRTKSAIFSWLQEVAYPPVNHLPQFAPTKFLPDSESNTQVRTSDEFLLIEAPQEMSLKKLGHSHVPRSPKYRVENVTAGDVDRFFYDYESGLLPRYLMSYKETEPQRLPLKVVHLTKRQATQRMLFSQASVLVEFVSIPDARPARSSTQRTARWRGRCSNAACSANGTLQCRR
ncbi:Hypothetical protein SCF082_LOCUS49328 [Durusdinium trenchii]|uniref:Uncharacterized protein n=1 Tax=Durusdinium trenchii TaxID=1381693 RepID=A0ABP0S0I4_9DINO